MAQIANETGLSRDQLYRSFNETDNPTLKTTIAVMEALGIAVTAAPALSPNSPPWIFLPGAAPKGRGGSRFRPRPRHARPK
jgi:hypothetical protein